MLPDLFRGRMISAIRPRWPGISDSERVCKALSRYADFKRAGWSFYLICCFRKARMLRIPGESYLPIMPSLNDSRKRCKEGRDICHPSGKTGEYGFLFPPSSVIQVAVIQTEAYPAPTPGNRPGAALV